jgi:hypothetical protein
MAAGSVWDEIFDTEHAEVVRTYIERWPRKDRKPEKVLIVVVQPDGEHHWLCPHCGRKRVADRLVVDVRDAAWDPLRDRQRPGDVGADVSLLADAG